MADIEKGNDDIKETKVHSSGDFNHSISLTEAIRDELTQRISCCDYTVIEQILTSLQEIKPEADHHSQSTPKPLEPSVTSRKSVVCSGGDNLEVSVALSEYDVTLSENDVRLQLSQRISQCDIQVIELILSSLSKNSEYAEPTPSPAILDMDEKVKYNSTAIAKVQPTGWMKRNKKICWVTASVLSLVFVVTVGLISGLLGRSEEMVVDETGTGNLFVSPVQ